MKLKERIVAVALAMVTCAGAVGYFASIDSFKTSAMEIGGSFDLDNDSEGTIVFQASVKDAIFTFTEGDTFVHTGEEICPKFTIRRTPKATKDLVEGTQYTVKYYNNIEPGTATVEITGVGQFKDTATATFTITHDYSIEEVVKPTATSQGYTLHKCSVCEDSYKDNFTPKLNTEIKYQTKDVDGDSELQDIRALLIVDEEDASAVDSFSAYLTTGGTDSEKVPITKAYKSVIADGQKVSAGEGKVFVIAKFLNVAKDADYVAAHFDCNGVKTDRTLILCR